MGIKVEEIIKEQFIKAIEEGKKPAWRSPYVGSEVAVNRVSKRPYHGVNVLFLHGEFASAKQWKELGYTCEKGKGQLAFFNARSLYQSKDKDGKPLVDEEGNPKMKTGWILRYYYVWERHNVRNDKGEIAPSVMPEKQVDTTPMTEYESMAKSDLMDYLKVNGIKYDEDGENRAYYMPALNRVHMPMEMVSETARILTLAHECAHSTGAEHLLNRKFGDSLMPSKEIYSKEELVAETASAIFCAERNVKVDFENTTAYLAGWAKYLHETPAKTILTAVYAAQKAARLMGGEPLESVKGEMKTEKAKTKEKGKMEEAA